MRNIIFDLGNVLEDLDETATAEAFAALGSTDWQELFSVKKQHALFDMLDRGDLSSTELWDFLRKELSIRDADDATINQAWCSLLCGIKPEKIRLLQALRQTHKLFLLSNTNLMHIEHIQARLQREYNLHLEDLFDKVYLSYEMGLRKPDLTIFQTILTEQNLNPAETLFIDDHPLNIPPAETLGIHTLHLTKDKNLLDYFALNKQNVLTYVAKPSVPVRAASLIKTKIPNFIPKIGIILGSGLGGLVDLLTDAVSIAYDDIPDFPLCHVQGHAGKLVLGYLAGVPVVFLQGRKHFYEGIDNKDIQILVRTLKTLGCEILLITNAVGSLRTDVGPSQLMLIQDHMNFQFNNALVGENDESFGPRFIPMDDAYDLELRNIMQATAKELDIPLATGVYCGTLGPNFETPAEIRAFRTLGADVVGMSTVSEVLVGRHCGLRVVVVSTITNFAAGMSAEKLSHELTLHYAKLGATNLSNLIRNFVGKFK